MVYVNESMAPSAEEARIARESSRKLAALAAGGKVIRLSIPGRKAQGVDLPRGAVELLVRLLAEMSKGNAVRLLPIQARLTTQQAAEILGVSRPFIVKELRSRRIPHQMVGTHRRILFKDLMAYKYISLRESRYEYVINRIFVRKRS